MPNRYQDQYGQNYYADAPMARAPLVPQARPVRPKLSSKIIDNIIDHTPDDFLMKQQRWYPEDGEDLTNTNPQDGSHNTPPGEGFDSYASWWNANAAQTHQNMADIWNGGDGKGEGLKNFGGNLINAAGRAYEGASKDLSKFANDVTDYTMGTTHSASGSGTTENGTQYWDNSADAAAQGAYDYSNVTPESQAYQDPYDNMADGGPVRRQQDEYPVPPDPATADDLKRSLSEGEFVIPADVVAKHGTQYFEKMIEKARKSGTVKDSLLGAAGGGITGAINGPAGAIAGAKSGFLSSLAVAAAKKAFPDKADAAGLLAQGVMMGPMGIPAIVGGGLMMAGAKPTTQFDENENRGDNTDNQSSMADGGVVVPNSDEKIQSVVREYISTQQRMDGLTPKQKNVHYDNLMNTLKELRPEEVDTGKLATLYVLKEMKRLGMKTLDAGGLRMTPNPNRASKLDDGKPSLLKRTSSKNWI